MPCAGEIALKNFEESHIFSTSDHCRLVFRLQSKPHTQSNGSVCIATQSAIGIYSIFLIQTQKEEHRSRSFERSNQGVIFVYLDG